MGQDAFPHVQLNLTVVKGGKFSEISIQMKRPFALSENFHVETSVQLFP